jgi:hypothetical protein
MSALRENASDLPCDTAADFKFHQAVLNLAVTQIFSTLKSDKLKDQPADYTRTLNALCRLTRENLLLQKHQDARATQQARQPKQLDVNREISDHERNIVLKRWRDFFGRDLTEPDPAQASLPAPPEPSSTQAATAGVLPTTPEHTSFAADAGAISPQNGTAPVFRASLPETARVHIDSDSCPSQSVEPCTAGAPNAAPLAKIENLVPLPPGNCSACNILLPPLLKNGERVVASI